jgi:predicted aspartyl protease
MVIAWWRAALMIAAAFHGEFDRTGHSCEIGRPAPFALDLVGGRLFVPTRLDGQAAIMMLDTGAARTVIDEDAVSRFRLPLSEWAAMTLRGAGGDVRRRVARIDSLELGGAALHRRSATGDMSAGVAPLGGMLGPQSEAAGLLGGDFLWGYDLELDMPSGTGVLHPVDGCVGAFIPWTAPFDTLPAFRPNMDWLLVQVTINGRSLSAVVDTGSPFSIVTAKGADVLGLSPARLATDPVVNVGGIGPDQVELRRHRFAEMRIGSQVMRDVALAVGPIRTLRIVDFVLGNDWLSRQHVWLSYTTTQVFVDRSRALPGLGSP